MYITSIYIPDQSVELSVAFNCEKKKKRILLKILEICSSLIVIFHVIVVLRHLKLSKLIVSKSDHLCY